MVITQFEIGSAASAETPVLSDHARERCIEMGISTKVAKRIWRHRDTVRAVTTPHEGRRVLAVSDVEPDYAIVVALESEAAWVAGKPLVVTVVFNVEDTYERLGDTYRVIEEAS